LAWALRVERVAIAMLVLATLLVAWAAVAWWRFG